MLDGIQEGFAPFQEDLGLPFGVNWWLTDATHPECRPERHQPTQNGTNEHQFSGTSRCFHNF
ncbi:hypothetical protein [Deinococcus sp. UYEF24]